MGFLLDVINDGRPRGRTLEPWTPAAGDIGVSGPAPPALAPTAVTASPPSEAFPVAESEPRGWSGRQRGRALATEARDPVAGDATLDRGVASDTPLDGTPREVPESLPVVVPPMSSDVPEASVRQYPPPPGGAADRSGEPARSSPVAVDPWRTDSLARAISVPPSQLAAGPGEEAPAVGVPAGHASQIREPDAIRQDPSASPAAAPSGAAASPATVSGRRRLRARERAAGEVPPGDRAPELHGPAASGLSAGTGSPAGWGSRGARRRPGREPALRERELTPPHRADESVVPPEVIAVPRSPGDEPASVAPLVERSAAVSGDAAATAWFAQPAAANVVRVADEGGTVPQRRETRRPVMPHQAGQAAAPEAGQARPMPGASDALVPCGEVRAPDPAASRNGAAAGRPGEGDARVHIGQIEVIVSAPPAAPRGNARVARPPAGASSLASRLYLRNL